MYRLEWSGDGFEQFDNMLKALSGQEATQALRSAVAHTGDKARTQVARALAGQTGLPYKTMKRALKVRRPSFDNLSYAIIARGGDVSLKYFKARETRAGVSAAPFGERRVFPNTFIKGGRFPGRRNLSMGGHVFEVTDPGTSHWGRAFEKKKSGVIIPAEMVRDASLGAWNRTIEQELPGRVRHEINRLLGMKGR